MISYLRKTFYGLFSLKYCCKTASVFEGYFLCFRQKRFSAEQAAEIIIADADDADDSSLPGDSGSEIESESECEYTHSDTIDEEEFPDNVFNDGMVPCRGLRTKGGYRRLK